MHFVRGHSLLLHGKYWYKLSSNIKNIKFEQISSNSRKFHSLFRVFAVPPGAAAGNRSAPKPIFSAGAPPAGPKKRRQIGLGRPTVGVALTLSYFHGRPGDQGYYNWDKMLLSHAISILSRIITVSTQSCPFNQLSIASGPNIPGTVIRLKRIYSF